MLESYFMQIDSSYDRLVSVGASLCFGRVCGTQPLPERTDSSAPGWMLGICLGLMPCMGRAMHPETIWETRLGMLKSACVLGVPVCQCYDYKVWCWHQPAGEFIKDTEEYINIELDSSRNRLIRLEIVLTAGTFGVAIFSLVAGGCTLELACAVGSPAFCCLHRSVGTLQARGMDTSTQDDSAIGSKQRGVCMHGAFEGQTEPSLMASVLTFTQCRHPGREPGAAAGHHPDRVELRGRQRRHVALLHGLLLRHNGVHPLPPTDVITTCTCRRCLAILSDRGRIKLAQPHYCRLIRDSSHDRGSHPQLQSCIYLPACQAYS